MAQRLGIILAVCLTLGLNIVKAQNTVIVVPMFGDDPFATPVTPVQDLAPSNDNYFIGSNRVIDEITGLIWQRDLDPIALNWQDAWQYCFNLNDAGFDQWRLPEPHELISIVDYTERAPAINVNAFPGTNLTSSYWTSQFTSNFSGFNPLYNHALATNFNDGSTSIEPLTSTMRVRCVYGRSAARGGVLRDNNNGTITDLATGLTWQQDRAVRQWNETHNYCSDLSLGGSENWRVPNVKELVSLADYRTPYGIHSDDWFGDISGPTWASHENVSNTNEAWVINNNGGSISSRPKNTNISVRCVH